MGNRTLTGRVKAISPGRSIRGRLPPRRRRDSHPSDRGRSFPATGSQLSKPVLDIFFNSNYYSY
jgi:hypothetical protein